MPQNEPDYQLISALRYDKEILLSAEWNTSRNCDKQSPYLLLSYTVDRLITAAEAHSWAAPSELTVDWLENRCDVSLEGKDPDQPYKVLSKGIPWRYLQTHRFADSRPPLAAGGNLGGIHTHPETKRARGAFLCREIKSRLHLGDIGTPHLRLPRHRTHFPFHFHKHKDHSPGSVQPRSNPSGHTGNWR